MLKLNEKIPSLRTDPLYSKEDDISKEQKALLGYKMADETFVETEGADESKSGITSSLMAKLKKNAEEEGEKKDESEPKKEDDKKDEKTVEQPKIDEKKEDIKKSDDAPKVEEPAK